MSVAARYQWDEIVWPPTAFPLRPRVLLAGLRGSEAHGTWVGPASGGIDDRDVMAVYVCPKEFYLGLSRPGWEHAEAITGEWDVVGYELRKFIGLLCQQNPNVLSLLWLEPEHYIHVSPLGAQLLEARALFRQRQRAFDAFTGYAHGQLKRMTHFGEFKGYMGAKRKSLVEKYGFDAKCAAHLLRLLHMGLEFLETGTLTVWRTWDREQLQAVKAGEVMLAAIQAEAEDYFSRCRAALATSPLPEDLDRPAIDTLCATLVSAGIKEA